MLHLILGRARTGKTTRAMQEIARQVQNNIPGNILIVPEQYSHEAERELCRVCGDRMSLCAEVLSFTRLAAHVETELGSTGPLLDKGGRLLCMSLALDAVGSRLAVYGSARRKPDLQRGLLQALDEFKTACVTPGQLSETAEVCGGMLCAKLQDLSLIFEAYESVVAQSGIDPMDRLRILAERLPRSSVGRTGGIWLDGFTDFTAQELQVIRVLLQMGVPLTVCLTCDSKDDGEHFAPVRHTLFALRRICKELNILCREEICDADRGDPALRHLERHLFAPRRPTYPEKVSNIHVYKAGSLYEECELAAGLALELVRTTGCRWRDIAIAVRGFDAYAAALENTFLQYDIPLFVTRRESILQKSLPALIDGAFEIITGGWDYEDVFAYLKTGLTGLTQADCDLLENYVYLWNLRGSDWTSGRDWSLHPEGYNAPRTEETARQLQQLNALRQQVALPLLKLRKACRDAETAEAHVGALCDFLQDLRLAERLETRAAALEAEGLPLLAAEYVQLWDVVVDALEQCAAILGDRPMNTEEFARLWSLLLSQYDVSSIPVSYDRVSAGDMDRMRRRSIRHLIVLGASDDQLPTAPATGGLITEEDRNALLRHDIDIGTAEAGLCREMSLIYNSLTLPAESLTLCWSVRDPAGSELRPSFVVQALTHLFDLRPRPVDVQHLRTLAPGPAFILAAEQRGVCGAAARRYFAEQDNGARLERLDRAAAQGRGSLGSDSVRRLYGDTLRLTASRVDKLSSCKFSYFMQYGLRARPRQQAGFNPPELGTFIHYLLEHVAADITAGAGFGNTDAREVDALTDKYVELYVRTELNDFRDRSNRFIYLFRRLTESARQIVRDMVRELQRSDFKPLDFELDFSKAGDLPPYAVDAEGKVLITGIADRVDGWVHEGKLYLRVLDYKTGAKKFSLADVCSGRNLQMLLYLFALEEVGHARYGTEIVPAGILYVPARDRIVSASGPMTDAELDKEREKARRRSGLLLRDAEVLYAMEKDYDTKYIPVTFKDGTYGGDSLADAEQLGKLGRFIRETLAKMAEELRRGSISADPLYRNQMDNACLYCDYFDACHFDESKDVRRCLKPMKTGEAWSVIEGGEADG